MKYLIITGISLLLLYLSYKTYNYVMLTDGLATKIRNGAIILDVRTASEYDRGHIPGAINISLGSIRERYVELDPGKTYITTCSHGLRSVKAEQLLKERGFKQVYNGGAWSDLAQLVQ
ncbi:MAG: rhodanese-like domain-containing protein [Sphingobacteriales bacterium]|nr:MAG: rhodanese-like domain-containing protein [Sphingobacteriales bacterium]